MLPLSLCRQNGRQSCCNKKSMIRFCLTLFLLALVRSMLMTNTLGARSNHLGDERGLMYTSVLSHCAVCTFCSVLYPFTDAGRSSLFIYSLECSRRVNSKDLNLKSPQQVGSTSLEFRRHQKYRFSTSRYNGMHYFLRVVCTLDSNGRIDILVHWKYCILK